MVDRTATLTAVLVLGFVSAPGSAQVTPPPPPGSADVTVVPGDRYDARGPHRALFGDGYRQLWTTPIRVPVVDLSALGGGVRPNRVGGGTTTRTLHLDGADGRRWVFRSVDKAPEAFEAFEGSALEGVVQDQVSAFHPTGAPVVARLLEAVGVLHTRPVFMVVPDDPRLEEFGEEFAGLLVLVEERPDDGPDGAPGFAGSRDIIQTEDLFERLEEHPDERVDARELLRARLVDLLVGDRDRSHNNHLWARFEAGDGAVWRVIPRDRDQAFVRFDGLLKRMARTYDPRLLSFGDVYPDVYALTRNAWDMDRRFLVGLDREAWEDVVRDVQAALDDDVIADAVRTMPPEHVAVIGDEMTRALVRRRDHLDEAADAFYRVVFSVADVHGTDANEDLHVVRGDDHVTVTLRPAPGDGNDGAAPPGFHRVFRADETSEIRIYLRGGDDRTVLSGDGRADVLVRIVGGGGLDTFVDEGGASGRRTVLYDRGSETRFPDGGAARVRRASPDPPLSWFEGRRELDWGTRTVPEPSASWDSDRGLVVAPGLRHDRYGFMKRPYGSRLRVRAGWAFGIQEPLLDVGYLARDAVASADLRLHFRWSGMEIINFYGFGNATPRLGDRSFHRLTHKEVTATVAAGVGDGATRYLEVGPTLTYTSTDTATAATFVAQADPYGSGKFTHAGVRLAGGIDTRDHPGAPTRGVRVEGVASVHPAMLDAVAPFQRARVEAATYLSPGGGNPVLALRGAGERVWGEFPFAEAAFLGGSGSVRSLREQRYAGDGALLGSAELRVEVGRIVFPVPSDVGFFALGDVGRVFLEGEDSGRWHSAWGGGVWFALVSRANVVRLSLARGAERTAFRAGVGFAY